MSDTIKETPLPKKFSLSRRNFLTVAGVGAGAFALQKYITRDGDQRKETESKWIILKGADGGQYVPIYENHNSPWSVDSFSDMPNIDVIMYEVPRPSKDMANQTGEQLLGKADKHFVRDTWIPKEHAKFWSEKGTLVAFEGVGYPNDSFILQFTFGTLLEGMAGLGSIAASFSDQASKPLKIADKEIMTAEMKKMLMRSGGIWGSTALLELVIGTYLKMMTVDKSEGIQNVPLKIQRLEQLTTQMHPEFNVVFLRNLIMARRLQAINELFPQSIRETDRSKNSPTTIAFNVGSMHRGIEDWLVLGHDIVKFMIELTPNGIWKQLVEINGSSKDLATMPLVLNNGFVGSKVIRIKDDWLQMTIDKKVS